MISTRPFLLLFSDMTAIETQWNQTYPSAPKQGVQSQPDGLPNFHIYFSDNTLAT